MKKYLKRTWKNKLVSMMWFVIGIIVAIPSGDITASVLCWMFGLALFFAKRNYIL